MKKALKIIVITLALLLGLVLIVAGVALAVVSSSNRLTKLANKYAPELITCDFQLDKAKLTFFKSFPNMGIDLVNMTLINPMDGSPSDTLACIEHLVLVVDADKFRKEKVIVVKKCLLENAYINFFTDSLGQNNFNVINNNHNDSIHSTFDYVIDIDEVKLKNASLRYTDNRSLIKAEGKGLDIVVKGKMQDKDLVANLILKAQNLDLSAKNTKLSSKALEFDFKGDIFGLDQINGIIILQTPNISLNYKEPFLQNDTLLLNLPFKFSISDLSTILEIAQIGLNRYLIDVDGSIAVLDNKNIVFDLGVSTNTLMTEDVLTYLPIRTRKRLDNAEYKGKLRVVEATVRGIYNDSLLPLISAKVLTDNAVVNVLSLPYPFKKVNLDADVFLNLNTETNYVTINSLSTRFNNSNLSAKGLVDNLLGGIGLKLKVNGNIPMSDINIFLPKTMNLHGNTSINLTSDFSYRQLRQSLKDYNLKRLKTHGSMSVRDFAFVMDTIQVMAPRLNVSFVLPGNRKIGQEEVCLAINSEHLEAEAGKSIILETKHPDIRITADRIKEGFEKMMINVDSRCVHLNTVYDSIATYMDTTFISFVTKPERKENGWCADIKLDGKTMTAVVGDTCSLHANSLMVNTSFFIDKTQYGFMNRWNPTAEFTLNHAVLKVNRLGEDIHIKNVDFLFDPQQIVFKNSTLLVGKSDLNIQGNLAGVMEWKEDHKKLMKGDFQLTSDMLDINEIMDLTSGWGTSSDYDRANAGNREDDPFMVPEGVDFNFSIKAKQALFDNFDLNHLSGGMTVKDGTLILQEIGFTNKAAEMLLTAMYQSPRRNNLFLAMDFHLLNVQINDLLHMIPFIDTLVPMLKTFDGQAEFHIGAETNLKASFEPKISTLRAAADIEGKNLSVNDHFTFTKITDNLDISTNGEYRVDSLNVQLTAFRDEIDLLPSQIDIGKYRVTLMGRMTLDKNGEYHLSVTESPLPTRFGLCISGPLNNLDYKLEKSKFPTLYKPNKRSHTEEMYLELKKRIADCMKENVK